MEHKRRMVEDDIMARQSIESFRVNFPPSNNITLQIGEDDGGAHVSFTANKTLYNKFRYWMFCKFFPFKIVNWTKGGDKNEKM